MTKKELHLHAKYPQPPAQRRRDRNSRLMSLRGERSAPINHPSPSRLFHLYVCFPPTSATMAINDNETRWQISSWAAERRKSRGGYISPVQEEHSDSSPLLSEWMWKMRIGIVVTPEELLFPDSFSAIFICQRGRKAVGRPSTVTGGASTQSARGSPVKEPRGLRMWLIHSNVIGVENVKGTLIYVSSRKLGNVCDDVNYGLLSSYRQCWTQCCWDDSIPTTDSRLLL